jgi:2-keto-3-deoxy-6-phosphogluconate aldolase
MMKEKCQEALKLRIIPVVAIHDARNANPLSGAIRGGGLAWAEITFRTAPILAANQLPEIFRYLKEQLSSAAG